MYTLIFVSSMALLGTYDDLPSCQNAIREIFAQKMNPPGQRLPMLDESINLRVSIQKTHLCVPAKKS